MSLFVGEYVDNILSVAEKIEVQSAKGVFFAMLAGLTHERAMKKVFEWRTLGKNCQYLVDKKFVEIR